MPTHNKSFVWDRLKRCALYPPPQLKRYKALKMSRRAIFSAALLVMIACVGCGEAEESIKYQNPNEHRAFIEMLEDQSIPYRVGREAMVFYPVQFRAQVKKIGVELSNRFGPEYSVISVSPTQLETAKSDFDKIGVNYSVLKVGEGHMIQWKREDNSKVAEILRSTPYYSNGDPSGPR